LSTLIDFRYKRKFVAQSGADGYGKRCSGKSADDLIIKVPRGTLIKDEKTGLIMADVHTDEPYIIARGGRGGWGNSHFATPTRQIPRFAKTGRAGEEFTIRLELKLIADVGLIGFPNVGKSTILSCISAAKPKIANYHFTTLSPVLGMVSVGNEQSFVAADIPGLIEGAAEGVGLGHDFLRHVERCRLLLHVVDISGSEGRNPKEDFELINKELANFSKELSLREQIVIGNKCDIATQEQIEDFKNYIEQQGLVFLPVSAATQKGLEVLPRITFNKLSELPPPLVYEADYVPMAIEQSSTREFTVTKLDDNEYEVEAPWLERILMGSNVEDYESLQYFQMQLADSGILEKLIELGVQEDDTIHIGDYQFDYVF
ncbi:MAG: GTPase ObgE, partial [Oscillospiraceae bacterium]